MKNFFAKHRHLIVISLIIAVILAALTPLLIPLGLGAEQPVTSVLQQISMQTMRAESYREVYVACHRHNRAEDTDAIYGSCKQILTTRESIAPLIEALKQATGKPAETDYDSRQNHLCQIDLYKTDAWYRVRTHSCYYVDLENGTYYLRHYGFGQSWQISEEDAWAILENCLCEQQPVVENPRAALCDRQNITSVSFAAWTDRAEVESRELTREQIDALCAFLTGRLTEVDFSGSIQFYSSGKDGWRLLFTLTDGTVWHLEYYDIPRYFLVLGVVSPGAEEPERFATYKVGEESEFANLPELLEEVP